MVFCTECGNPLQDGAKFCFQCGTPVQINTPDEPAKILGNSTMTDRSDLSDRSYVEESPAASLFQTEGKQEASKKVWTKPTETEQEITQQAPENVIQGADASDMEEDDDEYDFSQNDFDREVSNSSAEGSNPVLSKLSTADDIETSHPASSAEDDISVEKDPATDPFYDSIMPEIDNEIFKLPKDIFLKGIISVIGIIVIIIWLLFILS